MNKQKSIKKFCIKRFYKKSVYQKVQYYKKQSFKKITDPISNMLTSVASCSLLTAAMVLIKGSWKISYIILCDLVEYLNKIVRLPISWQSSAKPKCWHWSSDT